jgi:hypothetical protein
MKPLRAAVRWWVFLPFAPLLLGALFEYCGAVFYHVGLYRMSNAADALETLDALAVLPYMFFNFLLFHPATPKSSLVLWLELGLPATLCCVLLYGWSVAAELVNRHLTRRSSQPLTGE